MHYVPGHEVAVHIMQEVKNLAYSTKIPWTTVRETEHTGSYSLQAGDTVATKLVGLFDCTPEALKEYLIDGLFAQTPYCILEEYDRHNQILCVKIQFAPLQKLVRTCVYRYITFDEETQSYYVVFQSVAHDAVFDTDDYILFIYAPTGFLVTPVPDNPNKCKLTFVSQVVDLEQRTSKEFVQAYCATAGSFGQLWHELNQMVAQHSVKAIPLLHDVEDARRELYANFFELNASKGWKMVSRTWFDVFMKEEGPDNVSVAVRSRSFSTEPCRAIALRVYEAIRQASKWHWLIFSSEVVKEIDDSSCIVKTAAQALETGLPSETLYLLSCRESIDGVFDVTWKSIVYDEFPLPTDRTRLEFPTNGCIISPNGHGSTIQWLGRPPMVKKSSFSTIVGRATTYLNGALSYIVNHADYLPVLDPQTGEQIKKLPRNANNVTPLAVSMNVPRLRKRKLPATPALMSVEDVIVKIVPGKQPARPFLFLVNNNSEEGKRHRFVCRRWNSAISRSTFDLLPPELMEFVLSLLDASTLLHSVPYICNRFKELTENNTLWKRLYQDKWGNVTGRLALRYCGDDDPASFFTTNFLYWREVFWEREHIEKAWREPEEHAHGFKVSSGHTRDIRAVALMPNCHRLVTGSLDKLVRVWDAHSGVCLSSMRGISGVVSLCVASPTRIKVGYKSGLVRMADLAGLESVWEMQLAEAMRGCSFFDNSIVTWDEDVELWDEATQQRVRVLNGHTDYITECALSPSSPSVLFSASRDKTIKLWDLIGGTRIASISGHTRGVNGIAVVDAYTCVSVSSDKTMRVWDTRKLDGSGGPLPLYIRHNPNNSKFKCVRYSPTGNKICTGGQDGVHVWTLPAVEPLRAWQPMEPFSPVASLAIDEERLVSGARVGGVIRFYDFAPHR